MMKYASYTYEHPNFLVRYPHIKRNQLVEKVIQDLNPKNWLDYGAGDGALIAMMHKKKTLPPSVSLFEPVDSMCNQLEENLGSVIHKENIKITSDMDFLEEETFSLVTALEVLEHLPLPERTKFYCFLARKLDSNGCCLIEVPIEYGPILLLKEFGRKSFKNRKSEYTMAELLKTAFLGKTDDVNNRYDPMDKRTFIFPHHGFDISRLLIELNLLGECKEIVRSPFQALPRWLNQSVLFHFNLLVRNEERITNLVLSSNDVKLSTNACVS